MSYLVMECRAGYAVVLDNQGRFQKVPNLGYKVGQQLDSVVILPESNRTVIHFGRRLTSFVAAACLCLLFLGSHQLLLTSYGTVRLQINPDVLLEINRLDYVIGLEGMNEDGGKLIEGYRYRGKRLEAVSEELADLAVEEGFLQDGGKITLTVESKHEKWRLDKETVLPEKISTHMGNKVTVHLSDDDLDQEDEEDEDEEDRHETPGMKPPAVLPEKPKSEGNTVSYTVKADDGDDGGAEDPDDFEDDRDDMDDRPDGVKDDRDDTDDDTDDETDDETDDDTDDGGNDVEEGDDDVDDDRNE